MNDGDLGGTGVGKTSNSGPEPAGSSVSVTAPADNSEQDLGPSNGQDSQDRSVTAGGDPGPTIHRGPGIWSRQTIRDRAASDMLFTHEDGKTAFIEERLDPAGYRLAMGAEVYVSPAKAKEKSSVKPLEHKEAFFIPPGQFAFLLTEELVHVPSDAFAFIALRTRTKFKGLVNVSGFHADPGYHGRLVFAVFNAGPGDVHLRRGDDLFIVSFGTLDEKTEKPRGDAERFLHIPSDIITPIAGEVQSLAGLKEGIDEVRDDLSERLHAMERDVAILRWAVALVLSAFVTLLVRYLTMK